MWLEYFLGAALVVWFSPKVARRLRLSRAKHRSLAGHSRLAKRLAKALPEYHYDENEFCRVDGAPNEVQLCRRAGLLRLSESLALSERTIALTRSARQMISDMQLTGRNRVPFQFSPVVQRLLPIGSFWHSSSGVTLMDLDGREFFDLTGSYGVNVLGLDAYKDTMRMGLERSLQLGPVLGGYLPCVQSNASRLLHISGMDEVSFHMSGTEAVMQAVRLARYQTGRLKIVRFAGAYHGWWDDVQPGPGNPLPPGHVYTLADMSERSLAVIRSRKDIACVLVNPLQALHPNVNAPGDSTLIDGSRRIEPVSRESYSQWLTSLRAACDASGVALVLDEVFVGFRLALGGAQEYFNVKADLVCYGKTLAGGFPIGVVCGRSNWMRRYRPGKAADICFARGTFNSHPAVMEAMREFLDLAESEQRRVIYREQEMIWSKRVAMFNEAFERAGYPVRFHALQSIWTVSYCSPSRYHWMFQFYLRDEGIALSWVGTGRFIFSQNFSDENVHDVLTRMLRAAQRMQDDGWWWHLEGTTYRDLRRQVTREIWRQWLRPLRMLVSSSSPLNK